MFSNSKIEKAFCPKVEHIKEKEKNGLGGFENCAQLNDLYFPALIKVESCGFAWCSEISELNLGNLKIAGNHSYYRCFGIK
jgi:hypothetical protein